MYSFQPLVDTNWNSHVGFYVTVVMALMVVGLLVWSASKTTAYLWFAGCVSALTFAVTFVVFINSYRPQKVFANQPAIGTFVGFTPEVVSEKVAKYHHNITRRFWVTYKVNGELVILPANPALSYPERAVLYKN